MRGSLDKITHIAEVLHSLKTLAEAGAAGMLYHRAVVSIWKDQCIVQHSFG